MKIEMQLKGIFFIILLPFKIDCQKSPQRIKQKKENLIGHLQISDIYAQT